MPLVLFISGTDPRMQATLDSVQKTLGSDSLVYRYEAGDGAADGGDPDVGMAGLLEGPAVDLLVGGEVVALGVALLGLPALTAPGRADVLRG